MERCFDMFVHIALFKWRQGVTRDEVAAALKEVGALQEKIPGVVEISTGQNSSRYSEGYTDVVLVRAETQEAIDNYRLHPDHAAVAKKIEAMEASGVGVDFKTGE